MARKPQRPNRPRRPHHRDHSTWSEAEMYVLSEFETLNEWNAELEDKYKALEERVRQNELSTAKLLVKASLWASLAGAVVTTGASFLFDMLSK